MSSIHEYVKSLPKTDFMRALGKIFLHQIKLLNVDEIQDNKINVFIAGGSAVHYWTRNRTTSDVDAEFSRRFYPDDIKIEYSDTTNQNKRLYLDANYNPMFSLLHKNYQEDAWLITQAFEKSEIISKYFNIYVLSPLDLAVSKLLRFSEVDKKDIIDLGNTHLFCPDHFKNRAYEALNYAIGCNKKLVAINIEECYKSLKQNYEDKQSNKPAFK